MRPGFTAALGLVALAGLAGSAHAQASEEAAVIAVAQKMFDAMRTRDTLALRSVFDSSARLVGVSRRSGAPRVSVTPASRFIAAVGSATGDAWNERMWDPEVRIDGDIAQLWVKYDFHLGTKFSHCGIDAFQMARTSDGWKIVQVADTRRTEGCTPPPGK